MKRTKTIAKTTAYMNEVLVRLDDLIKSHCHIPDSVAPLEYMYLAMGEYVDPSASYRHHLCDEFPLPHLMRCIMITMFPWDIAAIATILRTMRTKKYNPHDLSWNFSHNHSCKFGDTLTMDWDSFYQEIANIIIHETIESKHTAMFSDFVDTMLVQISVPFQADGGEIRNTMCAINPFTGRVKIDTPHGIITRDDGMYELPDISIHGSTFSQIELTSSPDVYIPTAYEATNWLDLAERGMNRLVRRRAHDSSATFKTWFPSIATGTELDRVICHDGYKLGSRYYNRYSYLTLLRDIAIEPDSGEWIVAAIYILRNAHIDRGNCEYDLIGFTHGYDTNDDKFIKEWARCCDIVRNHDSILEALGSLDIWYKVYTKENDEYKMVGEINPIRRRYRVITEHCF